MHFNWLILLTTVLSYGIHADAQTCVPQKSPNPLGALIAKAALNEYSEFNGHRINADGHLWKFGSAESEAELLRDPDTGLPDANRPGRFAWRRIWEYWLTLEKHGSGEALSRKLFSVPELLENPGTTERTMETRLSDLFSRFTAADRNADTALRQAAVRAVLNDSPWSAAFISHLMDRAGLTDRQFRYAPAHWQYVKQAFEGPEGYAYQACDPHRTPPGIGDLLCYSRGEAPLKTFAEWKQAAQSPGFSAASHCEVVVDVDTDAKKMETIGGNVFQSVARRKLKLNEANVLSDSHNPDRSETDRNGSCAQDKTCLQPNLNLHYWGVLLQLVPDSGAVRK